MNNDNTNNNDTPNITDPIRIAVVGLGMWGRSQMKNSIADSPFIKCVGAFDANTDMMNSFCDDFNVKPIPSFDDIVNDDEIEAALLFTPNFVHRQHAEQLANAGKHAYLTKPIANYAYDGTQMIAAANNANTALFIDHGSSVSPTIKSIKRTLDNNTIGDVVMAQTNRSVRPSWDMSDKSWRSHKNLCPGGSAIQIGVYQTGMLYYLLGKPTRVTATDSYGFTPGSIESAIVMTVEYESGCRASVLTSYATKINTVYLDIFGIEGNINWGPGYLDRPPCYIRDEDWIVNEIKPTDTDYTPSAKEQFYRQIRNNRPPEYSTDLAIYAVATVDAARRAAQRRCAVDIEETLQQLPDDIDQ